MPEWLGQGIVAALAAVLGYFGRSFVEGIKARRAVAHREFEELKALRSLLEESHSVFLSQNYQARRLMTLVRANHADTFEAGLGFDATFRRLYPDFTEEERELHALIRSTSINSMRRLNGQLKAWLAKNDAFKRKPQTTSARGALAEKLQTLDLHLNQWQDKYEALIPNDERRCLVYLADEKQQGVGFPKDLGPAVERVIQESAPRLL